MSLKLEKFSSAILALLYLAVFAGIIINFSDYGDDTRLDLWFDVHEIFYLSAAFAGILMAVVPKPLWTPLLALVLGCVASGFNVFDGNLHPWLARTVVDHPKFLGNPQYTKLLFYALSLGVLGISFARARDTMAKLLTLVLLTVNLALVANNHMSYPDGYFKALLKDRKEDINQLLLVSEKELPAACTALRLHCRMRTDMRIVGFPFYGYMDPKIQEHYETLSHNITESAGKMVLDTNKTPSLYMTISYGSSILEVFDPFKVKQYWELSAYHFYRNSAAVTTGWYVFYIVLLFVHRRIRIDLRQVLKRLWR